MNDKKWKCHQISVKTCFIWWHFVSFMFYQLSFAYIDSNDSLQDVTESKSFYLSQIAANFSDSLFASEKPDAWFRRFDLLCLLSFSHTALFALDNLWNIGLICVHLSFYCEVLSVFRNIDMKALGEFIKPIILTSWKSVTHLSLFQVNLLTDRRWVRGQRDLLAEGKTNRRCLCAFTVWVMTRLNVITIH